MELYYELGVKISEVTDIGIKKGKCVLTNKYNFFKLEKMERNYKNRFCSAVLNFKY